jgi:hypothetical protein
MSLINVDLSDTENKLVVALQEKILPQIVTEVTNQIIPAVKESLVGLHIEVKVTCDISKS